MGLLAALFLAKSAVPLRHGRVAWLTAVQPITVAGPRPIRTAFPAAHACKMKDECMSRIWECQSEAGAWQRSIVDAVKVSDFSSLAYASQPVHAGPLANPRGGKAR